MIKRSISFLTLYIIVICSYSQSDTIAGNVRSVKEEIVSLDKEKQNLKPLANQGYDEYVYRHFNNTKRKRSSFLDLWYNTPKVQYTNHCIEFDKHRQPTEETWLYKNGDTIRTYKYKYGKYGDSLDLIQIKNIRSTKNEDIYTCENIRYNGEGEKVSSISYDSQNPYKYYYTIYVYDENRNLIEEKEFYSSGECYGLKYEYYSNGKISKIMKHYPFVWEMDTLLRLMRRRSDDAGVDVLYKEYFYDKNSNPICVKNYCMDDYNPNKSILSSTINYKYDEKGREISVHGVGADSILYLIEEFEYYEGGEIKSYKEDIIFDCTYGSMKEYFYNKDDFLKKVIFSNYKGTNILEFDYEFDNRNNWIKQTKTIDGEKLFIWKRDIKYYE